MVLSKLNESVTAREDPSFLTVHLSLVSDIYPRKHGERGTQRTSNKTGELQDLICIEKLLICIVFYAYIYMSYMSYMVTIMSNRRKAREC